MKFQSGSTSIAFIFLAVSSVAFGRPSSPLNVQLYEDRIVFPDDNLNPSTTSEKPRVELKYSPLDGQKFIPRSKSINSIDVEEDRIKGGVDHDEYEEIDSDEVEFRFRDPSSRRTYSSQNQFNPCGVGFRIGGSPSSRFSSSAGSTKFTSPCISKPNVKG
jgi:hypothetical protein